MVRDAQSKTKAKVIPEDSVTKVFSKMCFRQDEWK